MSFSMDLLQATENTSTAETAKTNILDLKQLYLKKSFYTNI